MLDKFYVIFFLPFSMYIGFCVCVCVYICCAYGVVFFFFFVTSEWIYIEYRNFCSFENKTSLFKFCDLFANKNLNILLQKMDLWVCQLFITEWCIKYACWKYVHNRCLNSTKKKMYTKNRWFLLFHKYSRHRQSPREIEYIRRLHFFFIFRCYAEHTGS